MKTLSNPNDDNVKLAERKLNYILTLKNTLETVPELHKLLETLKSDVFKKMYEVNDKKTKNRLPRIQKNLRTFVDF